MENALLGELSPEQFLADYWQKKPLLIRQAVPAFNGTLSRDALFDLARNPDVESRLVRQARDGWKVVHGPQRNSDLNRKTEPWTVLVQGVNLWDRATDALMRRFNFIPQSRLDDLMISYAVDGGGVGPHFDDYDVFLLQSMGQRRWQISHQQDRAFEEDAPLKILKHFEPEFDWVLDPGDMLYLPPEWAHNGIAVGECMTYSIGFRSPRANELVSEFIGYVQENLAIEGIYADPDLALQDNSAAISEAMVDQVDRMIRQLAWDRSDIGDFLGRYLSEPKPAVYFEGPDRALSEKRFGQAAIKSGLALDIKSMMLFHGNDVFLNGEALDIPDTDVPAMKAFAHARTMEGEQFEALSADTRALLHACYEDGFMDLRDG